MSGTNYFSYFPKINYTDGIYNKTAVNIFKRAKVVQFSSVIQSTIFYEYVIKDGERVEDIANRYYGDTQYYWIILYVNNIINVYSQWPKSNRQFEDYIISTYGSVEEASSTLHHYEDSNGNWISYQVDAIEKTVYDYEYDENEKKREIFIVRKEYIPQLVREMNNIFNASK